MTKTSKLAAGRSSSNTLTRQGNGASFRVSLPNGRTVDVCSKEGADEFVDTVGTVFISTNLQAKGDDQKLTRAYMMMLAIIQYASTEKIASGIPESELHTFIEHTLNTLDTLSIDRNWLRSGTVSECHIRLLHTVASFARRSSFLKIFLSSEGMEAVAKFYASRKMNHTPNHKVAETILLLVDSVFVVLKNDTSDEKVFGILEKTGLLGQFIRCVPVDPEGSAEIVAHLQGCLPLLKKKFKSGMPTGDILDAVVAGEDGPINEKAESSLARLQGLARLSNFDNKTFIKMCNHCRKCETQMDSVKLMKCQRCKLAYYCSKECQVANWKSHKKMCKALSSSTESSSEQKTSILTIQAFVSSNYFDIAKEVYKKTQEYNVPKKELLVEINFYGDAPALRNEFKVWLTSGVSEGSSVEDAPDWFRAGADKKVLPKYLREAYKRVTSDCLLTVCLTGNGTVAFQVLQAPNAAYELFSDETVESIGKEDYVRMVACLGQPNANKYFEKRSGLT
jgi:hypothetical protein